MYVYTDINTHIIERIQICYHSCKPYINTHISVCVLKYKNSYTCIKTC